MVRVLSYRGKNTLINHTTEIVAGAYFEFDVYFARPF